MVTRGAGTNPTAICYGEVLIDHLEAGNFVGGAPLNVAARLTQMGWDVHLISRVGDDRWGKVIVDTMTRFGLRTDLIQVDPEWPTGAAGVDTTEADPARFTIEYPSAWDRIELPALPEHSVLYFGTLVGRTDVGLTTLKSLLENSSATFKVCDVNLRPPWSRPETIATCLDHATTVKCSENEFEMIAPRGVEAFFKTHPSITALTITSGAMGSALHRPGSSIRQTATRVDVVDTVGAGDAFTAGLIDGLARNVDDAELVKRASSAAARAVQMPGGLPSR